MRLAEAAGVDIPDIKLVEIDTLDNLPAINLPNEKFAFAIRRFDRAEEKRIHMEDFAQLLVKYPYQKYSSANCEQIGKILYQYTGDSLRNVQQFARRLLVNILLANGDAHFMAMGAEITEHEGSRIGVYLFGEIRVFHRPHPSPDTDKGAVVSIRRWLEEHREEWDK